MHDIPHTGSLQDKYFKAKFMPSRTSVQDRPNFVIRVIFSSPATSPQIIALIPGNIPNEIVKNHSFC